MRARDRTRAESGGSRPAVSVCHGCCCARAEDGGRDPGAVRRADELAEVVRVSVADCLGPCEEKDVLVVRPSPAGRRAGGRPVWLARSGDREAVGLVDGWLRAGGPGVADLPARLADRVFAPPGRADRLT